MKNASRTNREKQVELQELNHLGRDHSAKTCIHREKYIRGILTTLLICFLAPATFVKAQHKPSPVTAPIDNPLSVNAKRFYGGMKMILLLSAQKMPEEFYASKPTEAVRSYGQIIG